MIILCFFFFKQKTAYEMRISDWSSDVCSSDLKASPDHFPPQRPPPLALTPSCRRRRYCCSNPSQLATTCRHSGDGSSQVGAGLLNLRDRKSVGKGKRVSVSVEFGGSRIIKKKKDTNRVR